jgi:hypothetical protein
MTEFIEANCKLYCFWHKGLMEASYEKIFYSVYNDYGINPMRKASRTSPGVEH